MYAYVYAYSHLEQFYSQINSFNKLIIRATFQSWASSGLDVANDLSFVLYVPEEARDRRNVT